MQKDLVLFFATELDRLVILGLFLYFVFLFIFKKEKKVVLTDFLFCLTSSLLALFISMIIKESFMIERPFVANDFSPLFLPFDPYSFPSSHASFFFAISGALFFLKKRIWSIFFIASFMIVLSRVLSGVHTFYDCFVGGLLGIFISYIIYKFLIKFFKL